MQLNAAKYPADRARGRSDKYEAYTTARALSKITAEQDKQAQQQAGSEGNDTAGAPTDATAATATTDAACSGAVDINAATGACACAATTRAVHLAGAASAGFALGVAVAACVALGAKLARR